MTRRTRPCHTPMFGETIRRLAPGLLSRMVPE